MVKKITPLPMDAKGLDSDSEVETGTNDTHFVLTCAEKEYKIKKAAKKYSTFLTTLGDGCKDASCDILIKDHTVMRMITDFLNRFAEEDKEPKEFKMPLEERGLEKNFSGWDLKFWDPIRKTKRRILPTLEKATRYFGIETLRHYIAVFLASQLPDAEHLDTMKPFFLRF